MKGLDSYDLDYGAYAKRIDEAVKLGETVVSDGHPKAEEVGAEVAKIKEDRAALEAAAAKKRSDLEKEKLNQMFKVKHSELTAWIDEKLAYLNSELGVESVSQAESALRTYDAINSEINKSGKKFDDTLMIGQKVVDAQHPQHAEIAQTLDQIRATRDKINELASSRGQRLQAEHTYQIYKVKHSEVTAWLAEKQAFIAAESNVTSVASAEVRISFLSFFLPLSSPLFISFLSFFLFFLSPKYF